MSSSSHPAPPPQVHLNPNSSTYVGSGKIAQPNETTDWSRDTRIESGQRDGVTSHNQDAQFVLVCINTKNSTALIHLEVSSLTNDQYFFQQMYQEYTELRRKHEFNLSMIIPLWIHDSLQAASALIPRLPSLPWRFQFPSTLLPTLPEMHLSKITSGDFVRVGTYDFTVSRYSI